MRKTQDIFFYLFKGHKHEGYYKEAFVLLIHFDKDTRKDTWTGILEHTICKIFGHKPVLSPNGGYDLYCKRCTKYLKSLSYDESKQYKREQKLKRIVK
jgi:hypothetical protein